MRIHLLSDLHFEFEKMDPDYVPPECDVVILAGDISPGLPGVVWAQETFNVPVIYVPGNHEFYHMGAFHGYVNKLKDRASKYGDVNVLYNDVLVVGDTRFIGTTLWTDYDLYGAQPLHQGCCQRGMADHATVRNKDGTFSYIITNDDGSIFDTYNAVDEHRAARAFIEAELAKPWDGKTVIVSHHGPSELSIAEKWKFHPLSPGYASRLEGIMLDHEPALWVHGHVHNNFDYQIGETRVVTNPRGYKGPESHEDNTEFNPGLVLEI